MSAGRTRGGMGMLRGGWRVSPVRSARQGRYGLSPDCAETPVQIIFATRNHHRHWLAPLRNYLSPDPALRRPTVDAFVCGTTPDHLISTEDGPPGPACAGPRTIDRILGQTGGGGDGTRSLHWTTPGSSLGQTPRPRISPFRGFKDVRAMRVPVLVEVADGQHRQASTRQRVPLRHDHLACPFRTPQGRSRVQPPARCFPGPPSNLQAHCPFPLPSKSSIAGRRDTASQPSQPARHRPHSESCLLRFPRPLARMRKRSKQKSGRPRPTPVTACCTGLKGLSER